MESKIEAIELSNPHLVAIIKHHILFPCLTYLSGMQRAIQESSPFLPISSAQLDVINTLQKPDVIWTRLHCHKQIVDCAFCCYLSLFFGGAKFCVLHCRCPLYVTTVPFLLLFCVPFLLLLFVQWSVFFFTIQFGPHFIVETASLALNWFGIIIT